MPRLVLTTNLGQENAVIFWQSNTPTTGWILIGEKEEKLSTKILDDKDSDKNIKTYLNHYNSVKNLKPNETYYFKIITDNKVFGRPDGKPFSFKTLTKQESISNLKPLYGKIITEAGKPLENAVVLLSVDNSYPLSTLTKSGGDFVIPLNQLIDQETNNLKTLSSQNLIKVDVYSEDKKNTVIKTNIDNSNPLPGLILLGKNYNFTGQDEVLSATSQTLGGVQTELDILFPKENAIIPANNPLIKGVALPNSELKVFVNSTGSSTTTKLKADKSGGWKLSLSNNLKPGPYTITIEGRDALGKPLSQTRNFTIAKSGESVLGDATPSANPTVIPTTAITTPVPTITPAPTAQITTFPLSTPVPEVSTPTPPVTGGGLIPIIASSLLLIVVGVGLLLAF